MGARRDELRAVGVEIERGRRCAPGGEERPAILQRKGHDDRARVGGTKRVGDGLAPKRRERGRGARFGAVGIHEMDARVAQERLARPVIPHSLVGRDAGLVRRQAREERGMSRSRVGRRVAVQRARDVDAPRAEAREPTRLREERPSLFRDPRGELVDDEEDDRGLSCGGLAAGARRRRRRTRSPITAARERDRCCDRRGEPRRAATRPPVRFTRRARSGRRRPCLRGRNSLRDSSRDTAGGTPRRSSTAARRRSPS